MFWTEFTSPYSLNTQRGGTPQNCRLLTLFFLYVLVADLLVVNWKMTTNINVRCLWKEWGYEMFRDYQIRTEENHENFWTQSGSWRGGKRSSEISNIRQNNSIMLDVTVEFWQNNYLYLFLNLFIEFFLILLLLAANQCFNRLAAFHLQLLQAILSIAV